MATDTRFLKIDGAFARPGTGMALTTPAYIGGQPAARTIDWGALNLSPATVAASTPTTPAVAAAPARSASGAPTLPSNQPAQPGGAPAVEGASTTPDPMDSFNSLMMDLLKGAQGVNTADLLKRRRELQREATARTGAPTPESLRTLSPSQQDAIRSGNTNALSPEIDANAYELEKAQQSIDQFFKTFSEASKISQDFAEKMVAPESVIANAQKIIQANPDSLGTVLSSFNDKSKQKVLEGLDYAKMAATAAAQKKSSGSGSSNITSDNERALLGQFRGEQIVKDFNVNLQKKLSVESIVKAGVGGPGDLALVFEFMKALDPNSVVRESEYATAAKSGNIFAGAFARFNGYLKENGGFLPPQVQQAFLSLVNAKFDVQKKLYDNLAQSYKDIAKRQNLNPDNVVVNYSGAVPVAEERVNVISPQGKKGDIPKSQLQEALTQGYKLAQ